MTEATATLEKFQYCAVICAFTGLEMEYGEVIQHGDS